MYIIIPTGLLSDQSAYLNEINGIPSEKETIYFPKVIL